MCCYDMEALVDAGLAHAIGVPSRSACQTLRRTGGLQPLQLNCNHDSLSESSRSRFVSVHSLVLVVSRTQLGLQLADPRSGGGLRRRPHQARLQPGSEGAMMIWSETLIALKFLNSSCSSSNCAIRAFRACRLIGIRQTVLCRAIRGDSISVNSALPPSYRFEAPGLSQSSRGAGVRTNQVESPRGIRLAAAPHYRARTLSKRLAKAKKASCRWRRTPTCSRAGCCAGARIRAGEGTAD